MYINTIYSDDSFQLLNIAVNQSMCVLLWLYTLIN